VGGRWKKTKLALEGFKSDGSEGRRGFSFLTIGECYALEVGKGWGGRGGELNGGLKGSILIVLRGGGEWASSRWEAEGEGMRGRRWAEV
jgi:hypothetical protein